MLKPFRKTQPAIIRSDRVQIHLSRKRGGIGTRAILLGPEKDVQKYREETLAVFETLAAELQLPKVEVLAMIAKDELASTEFEPIIRFTALALLQEIADVI
jgi:hypothetical protein